MGGMGLPGLKILYQNGAYVAPPSLVKSENPFPRAVGLSNVVWDTAEETAAGRGESPHTRLP